MRFWNKKIVPQEPFWVQVDKAMPRLMGDYSTHSTFVSLVKSQALSLLGYLPRGLNNTLSESCYQYGCYPHPDTFLIQWLKQRPAFHKDIKIAISRDLVRPLPVDVIVARKHLSKEAVELGLLGFSEVYASLQTLLRFVEELEKESGEVNVTDNATEL